MSRNDLVSWHLLKCDILEQRYLYIELFELVEQTYKESLGLGKSVLSVDALYYMARALIWSGNLEKTEEIIKQGEELLKILTQELPKDCKQREASTAFLKGLFYNPIKITKGDPDLTLEHLEQCLALREEYGDKYEVAQCLLFIGWIHIYKGELNHAFEYIERALTLAKESNRKSTIAWSLFTIASYYHFKGELDRSIIKYEQSLVLYEELNNKYYIANILNSMAETYRVKGEIERALECSEQSVSQSVEYGILKLTAAAYDYLIQILIEKGDLERAQENLDQLEQMKNELNDRQINLMYLFNKAILLKTSSRALNRGEAEKILRQILEDKKSSYEEIVRALLNLCELLLFELGVTGDLDVINDINSYIAQLLDITEKTHSYWVLGETYLLQAKLALITLDLKKARRLLTKGQQIAEKYGLNLLAMKISNEHDELLKQLTIWENLKESSSSLKERMELSRLNEQMGLMVRKRVIDVPELSDEDPVLLLVVSEGGRPIFSQSFLEDQAFEDHLFGGFFTAINSFINEKFSEGLDRAIFGEHTLLMNSVSPFLICYVYKGQSYSAQHRIKSFINEIQSNEDVWDTFGKYYKLNKEIQLKDIPSLEPLINDIFMNKTIPLNL